MGTGTEIEIEIELELMKQRLASRHRTHGKDSSPCPWLGARLDARTSTWYQNSAKSVHWPVNLTKQTETGRQAKTVKFETPLLGVAPNQVNGSFKLIWTESYEHFVSLRRCLASWSTFPVQKHCSKAAAAAAAQCPRITFKSPHFGAHTSDMENPCNCTFSACVGKLHVCAGGLVRTPQGTAAVSDSTLQLS
ncbi:hypothetical protein AXG93_2587s1270 [Marchantia polymorpha subsp. ruderalis]|uniref:Uncharacterized protein n=1 Tax=Marchantia polymorpha subsp. ruderalis TaxID=1480154 RepID=A0A176WT04_MARPO|nr:hypothetical protein AXG93_2587s1270 [Marchantia polymorpha subsp. ruderalis]